MPTQVPQGSLTQLLGAVAQDEDQYRHIIDWVQGPESSQWVNDLYSIQDPIQVPVADVEHDYICVILQMSKVKVKVTTLGLIRPVRVDLDGARH
ncbi:uncharacterized protein DS421_18g633320 [Arachis hypogaea]|nr:uncharacterized protein DS421_18g633320 [Arachis hypogaea]